MDEIVVTGKRQFERIAHAEIHGVPGMLRTSAQAGSDPTDIGLTTVLLGIDTRHCVVRDVHNVAWQADMNGGGTARIYGAMYDVCIFNVGWRTTFPGDRASESGGHGHYLYGQDYGVDGQKIIDTCVFSAGFGIGKIYGENGEIQDPNDWTTNPLNKLSNFSILNTVFVGKSFLIGGVSYGAHDIRIRNCTFLDCVLRMGYSGQNGIGLVVDSLLTKGLLIPCRSAAGTRDAKSGRLTSWERLSFIDNVVIIPKGASIDVTYDSPSWEWYDNTYYSEEEKPFIVRRENPKWIPLDPKSPKMLPPMRLTFEEWQAVTGFDANSTYHAALPSATFVREYPVKGLDKRASNLAIYNPLRVVDVSLPGGWKTANITNALNPNDTQEESVIYMDYPSALPEGWEGERRAPLPRDVSPVHGVWRIEAIEATEGEDAAAKIAELEARLAEREALLATREKDLNEAISAVAAHEKENAALRKQLGDCESMLRTLNIDVAELYVDIRTRDERIAGMSERIEVQQKIVDVARALWEASGRFGALMDGVP